MSLPDNGANRSPTDTATIINKLNDVVGSSNTLIDPDQQQPFLTELRGHYSGKALAVVRPQSTQHVSDVMKIATEHRISVVPQSGNTGLVGGQVPDDSGHQIVLSSHHLNKIREVDDAGTFMVCEAGVIMSDAHAAAEKVNRMFALTLPSKESCRIGGNLSTNAGGINALAYGIARQQVLGLEVVLADGRIWDGLKTLKKDNTGYDLKDLFIGAEGTLGIITAAVLRLLPRPVEKATAMVAVTSPQDALALFSLTQARAGSMLAAFEIIGRSSIDIVLRQIDGTRDPFSQPHLWYVLIELDGLQEDGVAETTLTACLEAAFEQEIILDAAIATSPRQAQALWLIRESISPAQRAEGANIKHDVSVPVHSIPEFLAQADKVVAEIFPAARPVVLGHFGDGNIHYNIAAPLNGEDSTFKERWGDIAAAVNDVVINLGGSISAEHGIGQMKKDQLTHVKSDVEMDMMRAIKRAFDPHNILNPGKVLDV